MLRCEITVRSGADRLLYEGLPSLAPVLDRLGDGAVLIGGLATAAWLTARPVGLPIRATRDIDLGIDRNRLGITGSRAFVGDLMREHEFEPGYSDEAFRFAHVTSEGSFVVDLLVAPGASRADPPLVERGLPTLAARGLAYALLRGPVPLELVVAGDETRAFRLRTIHLDAAFVMKGALEASGTRMRPDRRITDTVDAVMLAAACASDVDAMSALVANGRRSDVKAAVGWLGGKLRTARSIAARRVAEHVGSDDGAQWAVGVAQRFADALDAARSR